MFEDDSKVRQEIRKLRKRVKKSPLLFARLGDCYLQLGDWERAKAVLESGVEAHPEYTSGLKILGEGYLLNGRYGDAADCAARGLETDPNHLGLLQIMEKAKSKLEETDEATEIRDRLNTLDPLLYVHPDETDEPVHTEAPAETTEASKDQAEEALEDDFVEEIKRSAAPKSAKKAEPKSEADEEKISSSETEEILAEDDEEASEINKMIEEMKSSSMPETAEEESSAEAEVSKPEETESSEAPEEPSQSEEDTEPESPEAKPQKRESSKAQKSPTKSEQSTDEDTDPFGLEEADARLESEKEELTEPDQQSADAVEMTAKDEAANAEAEKKVAPEPVKAKKSPSKKESAKTKEDPPKKPDEDEAVETAPATGEEAKDPSEPVEKVETAAETSEDEPNTEKSRGKKKKIATKTLGELYATQQKFEEAIEIYEKLLEKDPDNNEFKQRLEDLKSRQEEALSTSTD